MITNEEKKYVYKSTLKNVYGLTNSLIKQLGEPDLCVKNPHHRSASAYLYLIERVEKWIEDHQAEVDRVKAFHLVRSQRAKEVYTDRYRQLVEWASTVEITVDWPDDIRADADAYYADDYDYYGVSEGGVLAYARHNCTNYHELLSNLRGPLVPGANEAYMIIKRRVNEVCEQRIFADIQALIPDDVR